MVFAIVDNDLLKTIRWDLRIIMILYKYRTDSERTEQIITKHQLWFATPDSLNDPLECSIQEIAKTNIEEFCRNEKQEQLEGFIFTYTFSNDDQLLWGLPKSRVQKVLDQIRKAKKFRDKYKVYSEFIKWRTGNYPSSPRAKYAMVHELLSKVGILSLSQKCQEELMWSHYADGGRGIAIGFVVPEGESLTATSACMPVYYSDEIVIMKDRLKTILNFTYDEVGRQKFYQTPAFDDPFLLSVITTKNTCWEYEQEWRCVEKTAGLKVIDKPVAEIIFGPKCPQEIRAKYVALVREHCTEPVNLYEIKIVGRKYEKLPLTEEKV